MIGEIIQSANTYNEGRIALNYAFSGEASFNGFSANTIYSGSTNLYDIFGGGTGAGDITRVQPGINTQTGGTANNPTISTIDSPSFNDFTASGNTNLNTLSAATIYSGNTDLYSIFLTTAGSNDITRVQPGSNIQTGGTANEPIINITGSPSFKNITVSGDTDLNTLSASTIYSGGTDLYNIFLTTAGSNDITRVQPGTNTQTGGTANNPTIGTIDSPSFDDLAASGNTNLNTLSASTIYSGGTDLYNIFLTTAGSNDITRVQPGINTQTGGTANNPTISTIDSPSFNDFTASGNTNLNTLSASTIYSGGTDLYEIFSTESGSIIDPFNELIYISAGNVTWDFTTGGNKTLTLTANTSLQVTGSLNGNFGTLKTIQGGVGSYTLTLVGTNYVSNGGAGSILLTSNVGAEDVLAFSNIGSSLYWNVGYNYTS